MVELQGETHTDSGGHGECPEITINIGTVLSIELRPQRSFANISVILTNPILENKWTLSGTSKKTVAPLLATLERLFRAAAESGEKLTLLLLSSLEDIHKFTKNEPDILKDGVRNIVLQGGYNITDGKLIPALDANNNRYDMKAAKKFHTYIQEHKIPSAVYTKVAAFATPWYADLFIELEKTGHPLGKHLRMVQVEQDLAFYIAACEEDPNMRFARNSSVDVFIPGVFATQNIQ
ncbi:hypothetical protein B0O99DRAFT_695525 [Bisporella sp. PMI_857]|nr:hypothetical protein B0O99DRAFT_695525 [Bisporella sp. PMI_857]